MALPERKDLNITLETVVCVYCGQVMGWSGSKSVINPEMHKQTLVITTENNPRLPPTCEVSPNGQHANMTPEQAKARGFL